MAVNDELLAGRKTHAGTLSLLCSSQNYSQDTRKFIIIKNLLSKSIIMKSSKESEILLLMFVFYLFLLRR